VGPVHVRGELWRAIGQGYGWFTHSAVEVVAGALAVELARAEVDVGVTVAVHPGLGVHAGRVRPAGVEGNGAHNLARVGQWCQSTSARICPCAASPPRSRKAWKQPSLAQYARNTDAAAVTREGGKGAQTHFLEAREHDVFV
jgi:hypothetical protein